MDKIQIGWKAKNEDNSWWFHSYNDFNKTEPQLSNLDRNNFWISHRESISFFIENHPEQPEISWNDSLQPIYIEA